MMTQQEFTDRTGLKVTGQEFEEISNIYMAAGEMDKDEFCKEYVKHGRSSLVSVLASVSIERECQKMQLQKEKEKLVDFLLHKAQAHDDIEMLDKAIMMTGHKNIITRKIALELPFWDVDREYIRENIK